MKKRFDAAFKAKVALEALKGQKTVAELARIYEALDISSYFVQMDSTTISSSGIYQFNRTLFDLPSNDISRTITITISVEDMSGNTGARTTQFTVYPVSPPSS